MPFKPITTQVEFDKAISARLAREREVLGQKYGDYEELKSRVADYETQLSRYSAQVEELTGSLASTRTHAARLETAMEYGLSMELAYRLNGNTAEEIAEDAQRLLRAIDRAAPATPAPPLMSTEPNMSGHYGGLRQLVNDLTGE